MASIFIWWFLTLVMGWVTFPIAFIMLKHFPDKGYVFSKILSLLLLGYLTWILGYLSFGGGTIFVSFLVLLLISGLLLWNWIGQSFFEFLKKDMGYLIVAESFFLMAFLVAGAYKMRTHDIVGTEKPMDFAMINGILSSHSMPPQDPWLSGGSISYYYFGYLIVAVLCKISQVTPGEAYNLAVAQTWALAAVGAFSLSYALTRRYRYSFFSAGALAILGNLDYWHRAIQSYQVGDLRIPYYNFLTNPGISGGWSAFFGFLTSPLQHGWDYFQASRIIQASSTDKMINEFPSFSFFLSDLHPHVMAIPFVLLAIAFAFNLLKASASGTQIFAGSYFWKYFQWALFAVVFGGLSFLNSWDFPTFMLLLGFCLFLQQWWANPVNLNGWVRSVMTVGVPLVVGAFAFYFPFYFRLQSQAQGLGLVQDRTDIYYLCVLFGLFFVVIVPVLIGNLSSKWEKNSKKSKRSEALECVICGKAGSGKKFCGYCGGELVLSESGEITPFPSEEVRGILKKTAALFSGEDNSLRGWITLFIVMASLLLLDFISFKLATAFFALLGIIFCLISLGGKSESKEMVFSTLLVLISFSLIFGCEMIYVRDMFSGGLLYRMNTVFKFHYQVWILLSIASGPFLKWLIENQWTHWSFWKKTIWAILAIFVLFGSLMYPALAFTSRMSGTSADLATMDGAVYYEHTFPTDYQAIEWIKANVKPIGEKNPIILEAWGGSYHQEFARVSTNTGFPTVLGWDFHEVQWRGSGDRAVIRGQNTDDTIMRRQSDVDAIYTSADLNSTRDLLKKYGVDYVYVGDSERQKYIAHADNLNKFSQLGNIVWQLGSSALYKLNP